VGEHALELGEHPLARHLGESRASGSRQNRGAGAGRARAWTGASVAADHDDERAARRTGATSALRAGVAPAPPRCRAGSGRPDVSQDVSFSGRVGTRPPPAASRRCRPAAPSPAPGPAS
jgi:hypothetical protein